ncbi:MAG TPA: sugar ABC transporter permease [Candidatus Dormibacteraeota bacterium]|nr:sugar ABC transporter permease [Candidatus Dormibacteraeota bacterium]
MRLTRRDRLVLFAPLAVLLAGWLVGPALLGLLSTFTTFSPFATKVSFVGLDNYVAVVRDPEFAAAARNIVLFTVIAVPLELVVGFAIAYLLREPFRGRAGLRVLLLLPWLVSPIGSGVMWHFLLGSTNGFLNFASGWLGFPDVTSPLGDLRLALPVVIAVEVWRLSPFVAFLLLPGLSAIPRERWDVARLSGASWIREILDVALPSIRPLLITVTMLLTGFALGSFDVVLILTGGGPGTATLTPALYSYAQAFETNLWPAGAASAWLIAGAVLVVGVAYVKLASQGDSR